jgi:predicted metal-dependent phosphoesterase TrpH
MKVELHAHTVDDPADRIPHTTRELIDRASALGYGALAITLHDRWSNPAPHADYARERGLTLMSGIERTIGRVHVLLVNVPRDAERVRTFDDVAALRRSSNALVIAPHPFYPIPTACGGALDRHADLVDAIEVNSMYTRLIDFNRGAVAWARSRGKPLVGNTDLHRLTQLGTTWSEVDVADGADADAIVDAIRAGRVRVETTPLGHFTAAWTFAKMVWGERRSVARSHARGRERPVRPSEQG